ncbi:unnamed protein product, partial [Mesorhabditis belari]|uniref:C-type lectin domain-containing protein n=1 Tax=Mesorhabditis belari TaxID=2138241 RepID=A0AAF3FAP0_9BILA
MKFYPTLPTLPPVVQRQRTTQSQVEIFREADASSSDSVERNTRDDSFNFPSRTSLLFIAYSLGSTAYIVFLLFAIQQKWECFTKISLPHGNVHQSVNITCPLTVQTPRSPCPNEWIYAETVANCYKLIYMVNLSTGESMCKSLGGSLTSIHSAEENRIVNEISRIGDNVTKGVYFPLIGGKRIGRGAQDWMWLDGTPWDYTNWAAGEPNHGWIEWGNYIEDCLMIYSDLYEYWEIPNPQQELHKWNDVPCSEVRRVAVCKRTPIL